MCPRGDDPRSLFQQNRAIVMSVNSSDPTEVLDGQFRVRFNGETTTRIPIGASDEECSAAFENIAAIRQARCARINYNPVTKAAQYSIALVFSTEPTQNNINEFDGEVPLSNFQCDASLFQSQISGAAVCRFEDRDLSMEVSGFDANDVLYQIQIINETTNPNRFVFSVENGNFSTEFDIVERTPININEDVYVTFASSTGHTQSAIWEFQANATSTELLLEPSTK